MVKSIATIKSGASMTNIKDGGAAFPNSHDNGFECGMTLRDWYAGMALQGLLLTSRTEMFEREAAQLAFGYADAMLKARQ